MAPSPQIEDVLGDIWSASMIVVVPALHLLRFCFGLSLLFYGMAFRTFAFHIIVFRLSGLKQVIRVDAHKEAGANFYFYYYYYYYVCKMYGILKDGVRVMLMLLFILSL